MKVCPSCGEENPERFRLCGFCGATLVAPQAPRETRKTVTVVFADLKDSTALAERLGTESLREALALYFDAMQAVIELHGGAVEKYIGDAIMAVFGLPTAHEDDALRAARAALGMRERLATLNVGLERRWGIRLEARTGINTGEVVADEGASTQRLVTGATVNIAARLEQAATPSEVLVGETTYALLRDQAEVEELGPIDLKGVAEPIVAYRLRSVAGVEGIARRSSVPLIGRLAELDTLDEVYRGSRRDGTSAWVTIVGPAGVGKSRLVDAFLASVPEGIVLRGRCLSYGEGITFWPLAEAIRSVAGIDEGSSSTAARTLLDELCRGRNDVSDRLAPLLGLSDAAYGLEETFWAVRRLVETLAERGPVVIVFDDIHWAEITLLDLIENLIAECEAPFVLVGSARDDLLEEHPGWGQGPKGTVLRVEALGEGDIRMVIANLLDATEVPEALVEQLARATEGNPLFVEQLVSHLIDGGYLRQGVAGTWELADDVGGASMPPTIHALLSARIDQLAAEARSVLQAGSVVGLEFYRGAVEDMSSPELVPSVEPSIGTLVRRQLIRSIPPAFADEPTYRFGHILIRDAAYGALLLRRRVDLHERFAAWLERAAGTRLAEYEEIVGYHLEQAARSLAELGSLDDRGLALAAKAAGWLSRSGSRAFGRGDMPAAANLLGRAATLLPPGDPKRIGLLLELAEVRADLDELGSVEATLQEALAGAAASGDVLLETNARLVELYVQYTVDPHGRSDQVVREVEAAIPALEAASDHAGLVRAWRLLGWVHGTACRYGAAELAVSHAVEHARVAGDRRAVTRNQMSFAISALFGPMPVPQAIEVCEGILVDVEGDRRAEGVVLGALAHLCAMDGDFGRARALYGRARTILEDLGGRLMAATVSLDSGRVELLAGDPERAERELRRDLEVLDEMGERYTLSTVAALLARAVMLQGRSDEALDLTQVSELATAPDDVESQNLWRRVRGLLLAADGGTEAAGLADEALRMVESTDAPTLRGGTLLDQATVLARLDRCDEAVVAASAALELYERKQSRVDVERTRVFLEELAAASDR